MLEMSYHYEDSALIDASNEQVFAFIDDHARFSSHMNRSSWMMGGGKMHIELDEGNGQKVGSHIKLNGRIMGFSIYLDEVVTEHQEPRRKAWKTVGDLKLLVIDHYQMAIELEAKNGKSQIRVSIDYKLPKSSTGWFRRLFGRVYAKWCVQQMLTGVKLNFSRG